MVSPYLLRPVRSLDEVQRAGPAQPRLEAVIRRTLAEARAAGQGPQDQIHRAATVLIKLRPEMTLQEALAAVKSVMKSG